MLDNIEQLEKLRSFASYFSLQSACFMIRFRSTINGGRLGLKAAVVAVVIYRSPQPCNKMNTFYKLALTTSAILFMLFCYTCRAADVTAVVNDPAGALVANATGRSRADEVCLNFSSTRSTTGWALADCLDVWTSWTTTASDGQFRFFGYREIFKETARELRRRGFPCLVESYPYSDGLGSSSIRHLVTWMFAEEMGCDWMKPQLPKNTILEDGTDLYCHSTIHSINYLKRVGKITEYPSDTRCLMTNWLVYFRYREHGVNVGEIGQTKTTPVSAAHAMGISNFWFLVANAEG